jgi:hypothetical protein
MFMLQAPFGMTMDIERHCGRKAAEMPLLFNLNPTAGRNL